MRATSRSSTSPPSVSARSTMRSKSSGVCSRDWAVMVAFRSCPFGAGMAPKDPAEIWAFCDLTAPVTSLGDRS